MASPVKCHLFVILFSAAKCIYLLFKQSCVSFIGKIKKTGILLMRDVNIVETGRQ